MKSSAIIENDIYEWALIYTTVSYSAENRFLNFKRHHRDAMIACIHVKKDSAFFELSKILNEMIATFNISLLQKTKQPNNNNDKNCLMFIKLKVLRICKKVTSKQACNYWSFMHMISYSISISMHVTSVFIAVHKIIGIRNNRMNIWIIIINNVNL